MTRKVGLLTTLLVLGLTTLAFAADAGASDKAEGLRFFVYSAVAAGLGIAIAAFGWRNRPRDGGERRSRGNRAQPRRFW